MRRNAIRRFAGDAERFATRREDAYPRRVADDRRDRARRRCDEMFAVIDHQQQVTLAQGGQQR